MSSFVAVNLTLKKTNMTMDNSKRLKMYVPVEHGVFSIVMLVFGGVNDMMMKTSFENPTCRPSQTCKPTQFGSHLTSLQDLPGTPSNQFF